jgi:hypothetical protein
MSAAERETSRVDVRSADGTSIAVWVAGEGPPLVLVHGSLCDHPGSTREFEDVAAVVDAVADRTESRRVGLTDRASSRGSPRRPSF